MLYCTSEIELSVGITGRLSLGTQAEAAAVRSKEAEAAAAAGSSAEEHGALTASLHHAQQANAVLKQQVDHCQGLLEQTQTSLSHYRWMLRGATEQYDVPQSYMAFDRGFESHFESTASQTTEATEQGKEGRSLWEVLRYVVQSELYQQFVDPNRPNPPAPVPPGAAPAPRLDRKPSLEAAPLPRLLAELPDTSGDVQSETTPQDEPSHVDEGASCHPPSLRKTLVTPSEATSLLS
jgi:hypothetical protein